MRVVFTFAYADALDKGLDHDAALREARSFVRFVTMYVTCLDRPEMYMGMELTPEDCAQYQQRSSR